MGAGGSVWYCYFRCTSTHTLIKICALICAFKSHVSGFKADGFWFSQPMKKSTVKAILVV